MTNGIDTLPIDQEVSINGVASFTPKPRYEYGLIEDELAPYSPSRLLQAFVPARQEVLEEPETQYAGAWEDVRLDEEGRPIIEKEVKPGKYGEPEWDVSHMPIYRAVEKGLGVVGEVMQDPSMIPRGIAQLPEFAESFGRQVPEIADAVRRQLQGSAQTAIQGRLEGYDPETGEEFRAEDIMSLAPVTMGAGTAVSIARTAPTGEVFGIFGGSHMKSYAAKEKVLQNLEREFEARDKTNSLVKQEMWERQYGDEFKIYRSAVDNKPRIEINTSGAKLKRDPFNTEGTTTLKVDVRHLTGETELMLGDILDFPTLYKEYPKEVFGPSSSQRFRPVSKIGIRRGTQEELGDSIAAYDKSTDTIILGRAASPEEMHSAILHEVQHAIQNREGFYGGVGSGISNSMAKIKAHREFDLEDLTTRLFKRMGIDSHGVGDIEKQVLDGLVTGGRRGQRRVDRVLGKGAYARIRPNILKKDIERLVKLRQELKAIAQMEQEYVKKYWQNPGEVEASNVEQRILDNWRTMHPELSAEYIPEEMVYSIPEGGRGSSAALSKENLPR